MIEPNIAIGAGLSILASKDILNRLLGPTADYVGGEIKGLIEKCNVNLNDIFSKACRKLGKKIDEEGIVPPRVLKRVLDDGRFCEDDLAKEYFAGVLAASRSKSGTDDRGVAFAHLVSVLSSHQIRTHFLFYSSLRELFLPFNKTIMPGTDRRAMMVYIPTSAYFAAMGLDQDISSFEYGISILSNSINWLRRNDLIENEYVFGNESNFLVDQWQYRFPEFPIDKNILREHGMAFQPTPGGMELFLWVHCLSQCSHFSFLDSSFDLDLIENVGTLDEKNILYQRYVQNKETTIVKGYRDRSDPHRPPLPHDAAYGSV